MGMLIHTSDGEAVAILAAMRDVAGTGTGLSETDRASLDAAGRYILARPGPVDADSLPPMDPAALAQALASPDLRTEAARFATVMAFVDGQLDGGKMRRALAYARALDVDEDYVAEIAQAADGRLRAALAHMVRDNMESVTGRAWTGPAASLDADIMAWMLPYREAPDPGLAARFRALADLPDASFGRQLLAHFDANGYALPGEADGLNAAFSLPHDAAHVFAGYDTDPRGELLVSTFTAGMHPVHPLSGHILPVIFSWHLGIRINDVAKSATGALDPEGFWQAWARGRRMKVDIFAPDWDFWAWAEQPLDLLRARYLDEG